MCAERELPYERPHLSKGYLLGTVPRERLGLRPAEQYRELRVELRLGERVAHLGVESHAVVLESGATITWDLLCVATGSSARRLPGFEGGLYLRELADADALTTTLEVCRHLYNDALQERRDAWKRCRTSVALELLRRGQRLRTERPAIAGVALEAPSFSDGA